MFHVYKITNKINGKFYIGVHKTEDFERSSYMGSGPLIRKAVRKYGKVEFIRESLFVYQDKEEAYEKERSLINCEDPLSYNLKEGGIGGWEFVNSLDLPNPMHDIELSKKQRSNRAKTIEENKDHYDKIARENLSKSHKARVGKKDSDETKKKRVESLKKHWETNEHPLLGVPLSDEHKKKCSEGWTEEIRNKKSIDAKEWARNNPDKLRTNLGKTFDDEHRQKMSESWETRPMLSCPHCGISSKSASVMKRWHFDNCKSIK